MFTATGVEKMRMLLQRVGISIVFLLGMFISACGPSTQTTAPAPPDASTRPQSAPPPTTTPPPVNPEPAPQPSSPLKNEAVEMPLTLPVLDAFFSDDAF